MNEGLNKIISLGEHDRARKAAEAARASAEAQDREKVCDEVMESRLEKVMREVVLPVLDDGAIQLKSAGFSVVLDELRRRSPTQPMVSLIYGVVLEITRKDGKVLHYVLKYEASLREYMVTVTEAFGSGPCVMQDGHNVPLAQITTESVSRHLELFMEHANEHLASL